MIFTLDKVRFRLNENHDKKVFCRIAGVNPVFAEILPQESIEALKKAVRVYRDLQHSNLINLIEHYSYNRFYVAAFKWEN